MSSRDVYDELLKSGISQKELDSFLQEQKDFVSTAKNIRSRNTEMGLSSITPRAYTPETLKTYSVRTGKTVRLSIKDIRASQRQQTEDYNGGATSQIKEIVNSSINEISDEFANREKALSDISSRISKEDLEYLQKLNAELTRYSNVLETENVPQKLYDTINDIINQIRAEIYEVLLKYL
jgi:hypothetical protein